MANEDQPEVLTREQVVKLAGGRQPNRRLGIDRASRGSVLVFPLMDPEDENAQVRYVCDGKCYWFRADTDQAQEIRNGGGVVIAHG